jgi:hypothetical protein
MLKEKHPKQVYDAKCDCCGKVVNFIDLLFKEYHDNIRNWNEIRITQDKDVHFLFFCGDKACNDLYIILKDDIYKQIEFLNKGAKYESI